MGSNTNKYSVRIAERASEMLMEDKCIYIDAVVDCRQDYRWLL
jgi:hypothetical protein